MSSSSSTRSALGPAPRRRRAAPDGSLNIFDGDDELADKGSLPPPRKRMTFSVRSAIGEGEPKAEMLGRELGVAN
jgi:hypothetical protein